MEYTQLRREICDIGRRMYDKNFVASNDGNISARLGPDTMIITPSGVSKGYMQMEDMIIVDFAGNVLQGDMKPSSEMKMHAAIYQARPDVQSVVHAHPQKATAFAVAGIEFDQVTLPELIFSLGVISLAGYATPTTDQLPLRVVEKITGADAVLMANHGAVTVGKDILDAYLKMETLEHFCAISIYARQLGDEKALSEKEVCKLYRIRKDVYGKETPMCDNCGACERFDFTRGDVQGGIQDGILRGHSMGPPDGSAAADDAEIKARVEAMVRSLMSKNNQ